MSIHDKASAIVTAVEMDRQLWASVVGASFARQVWDWIADGHGPPDDGECDRMLEEAQAVADNAIEARIRARGERGPA